MSEQKEYNFLNYLDVYTKEIILPGSGKSIIIKPLTTNQMKKLLVNEEEDDPIKGDEILDDILKFCIDSKEIEIDDLLLQDRYFIFIEIRKLTKGSNYSYEFNCPKCKGQSIQNINLDDLELTNMDNVEYDPVLISNDKIKIYLKHITRLEQKRAYSNLKNKNKSKIEKAVNMIVANIAASIYKIETDDGVEENIPFDILFNMVGNLPGIEYDKLKEWYEKNDFGINLNIKNECIHCNYEHESAIPLDNFFQ